MNPETYTEVRYPLSANEQAAVTALLAAVAALREAPPTGTIREGYDAMTSRLTPIMEGVSVEVVAPDVDVDAGPEAVRGCWVRPENAPADRAILFVHGGAYRVGSSEGYRGMASQVVVRSGVAAFVLDYPLAPEHPFPAAFDATVAALRWLRRQGVAEVALVGDSAGGGLVLAALAQWTAEMPKAASAVTFSAWTDLALAGDSFRSPDTIDPTFQPPMLADSAANYLGEADPKDGRASPLYAIPGQLPALLLQVGSHELLLDDSVRYAHAAAERGGEVRLEIYEGLHHVFQRCVRQLQSARDAFDGAATFIGSHWS